MNTSWAFTKVSRKYEDPLLGSTHALLSLYLFSKYGYLGKCNSQLSLNFSQMFNKVLHNILTDKKNRSSDWLDGFIGNVRDFAFKNHLNALLCAKCHAWLNWDCQKHWKLIIHWMTEYRFKNILKLKRWCLIRCRFFVQSVSFTIID